MNSCNIFPSNKLGRVIGGAVFDVMMQTSAPVGLIATTALSASAAAIHSEYDVMRPHGGTCPTSLFSLIVAESGERKTTVDNIFFAFLKEFDQEVYLEYLAEYGDDPKNKPPRFIYSDTTPIGFVQCLSRNSPNALLIEDEAGRVFSSDLIGDLALLNKGWDGATIYVDRAKTSFRVINPRVGISWMIQPRVFKDFLDKKGDQAKRIGFFARCLVAHPQSTQGNRFKALGNDGEIPDYQPHALTEWRKRATALIRGQDAYHRTGQGVPPKKVLKFSEAAASRFIQMENEIEVQNQYQGRYFRVKEFGSKLAENIARISAVLHLFDDNESLVISVQTLESAIEISKWYAREYLELFDSDSPSQIEEYWGNLLWNWLVGYVHRTNQDLIPRNTVLQLGPAQLRKTAILDIAIENLFKKQLVGVQENLVSTMPFRRKKTRYLHINRYYVPPRPL